MPLTVQDLLKDRCQDLQFELIAGSKGQTRLISVSEINRPGLALGGFFDNFRWERVQVIGRGEQAYINQVTLKKSKESLREFFKFGIPCMVLTHHAEPQPELVQYAEEFQVPLLLTSLATAPLIAELSSYLEEKLSPAITVHGVLVDIYGLGVLITGDSGIGKSECALELVKRGHLLVADDVVRVQYLPGGVLNGKPVNEMVRHLMEVRGLGIINVKELFGVSAILDSSRIGLTVHLELWDNSKEFDRMGMEDHFVEMIGVRVPRITLPVRPGRNLAILIEVAALYERLKERGINTAQQIEASLLSKMGDPALESKPGRETRSSKANPSPPIRTPYRRR